MDQRNKIFKVDESISNNSTVFMSLTLKHRYHNGLLLSQDLIELI